MSAVELTSVGQPQDGPQNEQAIEGCQRHPLSKKAVALLALQHLSFAWTQRTVEFAAVVCLVLLFPETLLPGALCALVSAAAVAVLSGYVGSLVDKVDRLHVVRACILVVKARVVYSALIVLFLVFRREAPLALQSRSRLSAGDSASIRALLAAVVIFVAVMDLAAVGHNVAILRDWAVAIADDDTDALTRLNTILRRVDLVCKLLAPLFVSALTSTLEPAVAVGTLLAIAGVCFVFEVGWIGVVYRSFPALQHPASRSESGPAEANESFLQGLRTHFEDWKAFVQMPVFLSSLAISFLYFTTLSFDGSLINYMINVRQWEDSFVAGMRGIGVVTGLLGTAAMPFLERKLGLVRAGNWSIWFQVACLLPAVLSFYVGVHGDKFPAWNSAMLLTGVLLSRIGLWSFDLVQLKELQTALDAHPRRNALTGLQYALQSVFGAATSVLTLAVASPRRFGVTALVSFAAVLSGAVCYAAKSS
ncbi:hypothetical protein AURDEDRAFT_150121 [Auricularia subglabra TFB-10046 SS5]|nr:hypothetical protein AURDEDRAFT_150121 [Auricularia subglabra TFB-10046 SS5]